MNLEERKELFLNRLYDKFYRRDFQLIDFKGTKYPLTIVCDRCGRKRTLSRAENLLENRFLCQCEDCSPNLKAEGLRVKKAYEEWYTTKGYLKYEEIKGFYSIGKKVTLKCKKCGAEQNRNPKFLLEKDDLCLCCEKRMGIRKTQLQFEKDLENVYGGEYTLVNEYKTCYDPVLLRHNECGKIFSVKPRDFLYRKRTCPICTKSRGEKKISDFLIKNNVSFETQFRLDEFRRAPFDFKLNDYNILIEFQGRQHYEPVAKFGGEEQFEHQLEIDNRKKELAEKHGYNLIYFSYLELPHLEDYLVQRLSQAGVELSSSKNLESQ